MHVLLSLKQNALLASPLSHLRLASTRLDTSRIPTSLSYYLSPYGQAPHPSTVTLISCNSSRFVKSTRRTRPPAQSLPRVTSPRSDLFASPSSARSTSVRHPREDTAVQSGGRHDQEGRLSWMKEGAVPAIPNETGDNAHVKRLTSRSLHT